MFLNKNLYINTIKEKTKSDYWGTTHTTSLKPTPAATNLLYPRCFSMGTTWVQLPTTSFIMAVILCLSILSATFYNLLCVVCNFFLHKNAKNRNNE
jgi:hypothetical protein